MRILEIQQGLLLAALLVVSHAVLARGDSFLASSPRAAFVGVPRNAALLSHRQDISTLALSVRGGATRVAQEEEDSDEEEEDLEESEDEAEEDIDLDEEEEDSSALDASLAAAAVKSTQKAKTKAQSSKTSTVKKTVSATLSKPKKQSSLHKFFRVPYILRACLNPFTVASMTKHFWISLMKLEYPPKDASQDLRSALDEKARKGGPTTQARGRRKMKRGQAKTLSDLPKLNT